MNSQPYIVLNNWRFEYGLDGPGVFKLGGVTDTGVPFIDEVVELRGFRWMAQFEKGFMVRCKNHKVELGDKERWDNFLQHKVHQRGDVNETC